MIHLRRAALLTLAILLSLAPATLAQRTEISNPRRTRSVIAGQKMKFRGVVISRDADVFTIRDRNRADYQVLITDNTSIKTHGGVLSSGKKYPVTDILRGLLIEVEGRGNAQGQLVAKKIRFNESDMRAAITSDTRVSPVEANQERMAGQMDELYAVAAEARAEVKAINERVSAFDDYDVQETVTVTFRTNSTVLSPEAKRQLDALAEQIVNAKGYMFEIAGYTDSTGSSAKNFRLSQQRAEAVVNYLAVTHKIPLRRFVTPMGYGETEAVADNTTREGRSQKRRVDVKMSINRGLANPQGLKDFPWPPNASASMIIQRSLLMKVGQTKSLKDIGEQLQAVLNRAGYGQGGFYGVPGGFALASRLEQFNQDDGAPLQGNNRWVIGIIPPSRFSKEHFQSFLRPLSGSYRLIVFTVRDKPSEGGGEAVTSERAEVLSLEGSNTLPDEPFRRFARA
jgi:OOP family OmpA-OmpF porin